MDGELEKEGRRGEVEKESEGRDGLRDRTGEKL